MPRTRTLISLSFALFVWPSLGSGCGPDATSGGPVTGSATGSAASGEWDFESLTTSCSGVCSATVAGFTVNVCEVGAHNDATVTITQTDGRLQVDSDDSDYISRLTGRVDANGFFDVSGTRTLEGTNVQVRIHGRGNFADLDMPNATLTADADGTLSGTYQGQTVNCRLVTDVTGTRTATVEP